MSRVARKSVRFKNVFDLDKSLRRSFFRWYRKSHQTLGDKLIFVKRSKNGPVEFCFRGLDPGISCVVHNSGLSVYFYNKNKYIDIIFEAEAYPEKTLHGFACSCCDLDKRVHYKTLPDFWFGEVFRPFTRWLSDKLLVASGIHWILADCGSTSASLVACSEDEESHRRSLRWLLSNIKAIGIDAILVT